MTNIVRRITKDGYTFAVTFDEYGVVDTIWRQRGEEFGGLLVSTHRDARAILRGADKLLHGIAPKGFAFAK